MTNRDTRARDLDALQHLLDSHGADRTRWPAPARLRFAGLIAESPEARRLVAEAEALDRLLDRAPLPSDPRRAALADRIAAAALAEDRASGHVVALPSRGAPQPAQGRTRFPASRWSAAALLAASLVLGVFAGVSGAVSPAVQRVAALTGIEADTEAASVWAAWEDFAGPSEEDTL